MYKNLSLILGIWIVFGLTSEVSAQSNAMSSGSLFAVANAVNHAAHVNQEDFLPHAEPMFGMNQEDYQDHFEEYREGSLMERILHLENMELQAIYADSKMNEINVSFNVKDQQEVLVAVYDSFGSKVYTDMTTLTDGLNNYHLETSQLSSGFYSMVVSGKNDQFIQRFLIE